MNSIKQVLLNKGSISVPIRSNVPTDVKLTYFDNGKENSYIGIHGCVKFQRFELDQIEMAIENFFQLIEPTNENN